jgi:hypothetical protein
MCEQMSIWVSTCVPFIPPALRFEAWRLVIYCPGSTLFPMYMRMQDFPLSQWDVDRMGGQIFHSLLSALSYSAFACCIPGGIGRNGSPVGLHQTVTRFFVTPLVFSSTVIDITTLYQIGMRLFLLCVLWVEGGVDISSRLRLELRWVGWDWIGWGRIGMRTFFVLRDWVCVRDVRV